MARLELEQLLLPISEDAPCGDNLEYDPEYGALERAAQGKEEQQFGDTVVAAEDPDWREVKSKAIDLLVRTKDMRIVAHLSRAVLATDGLPAFAEAMALLRGMVDRYWETVHPQLDPDDDNDPMFRINTLTSLCDPNSTLRLLRETPIVSSRSLGRFSLRDVQVAAGELPSKSENAPPPEKATIDAAFLDCELEELKAGADAVSQSIEHASAIESSVTEIVGAANSTSLNPLVETLQAVGKVLGEQLARRGVSDAPEVQEEDAGNGEVAGEGQRLSGEIHSREDVIRALDKVCEYYDRREPSSPLPLLLRRAQRLASKSFLEIIRDLTPEGLTQAQSIGGVSEEEEEV